MSHTDGEEDWGTLLVLPVMRADTSVGAVEAGRDEELLPRDSEHQQLPHPIDQLAQDLAALANLIGYGGDEEARERYRWRIERALDLHIAARLRQLLIDALKD